jgi:transposase
MSLEITEELIARQPPEAQAIIRALLARVAALEAQLGKTPKNSSLPPSSQHPHAKPPGKKNKSRRKRGAQPGHQKHERTLIPSEACREVIVLKPTACRRCGGRLAGEDPAPWRHQVWELPEIQPIVVEYQQHRLTCPGCRTQTCATLPPGVPAGQSGPRLIAFTALLMAYFRQSKRRTAEFLQTLLGQPCSTGLTVKHQNLAAAALEPAYQELAAQLPQQARLGIDETATKQAGEKAWLWTFVATGFTVFGVRLSRSAEILSDLLTSAFCGTIHCDRAKMYWSLGLDPPPEAPRHRLQWCWAHLKRDFQALLDSPDRQVQRLGRDLMRPTRELFALWGRVRDGTLTRRGFQRLMQPIRQEIEGLLLRGKYSGHPRLTGMCEELYGHREWLWTFVEEVGVEPTNNASERSLRHAVIWRKLSFGTQSESGSRFVERLLTVIESCRQQSRNVLEFLTATMQADFHNQPPPSLLPNV